MTELLFTNTEYGLMQATEVARGLRKLGHPARRRRNAVRTTEHVAALFARGIIELGAGKVSGHYEILQDGSE